MLFGIGTIVNGADNSGIISKLYESIQNLYGEQFNLTNELNNTERYVSPEQLAQKRIELNRITQEIINTENRLGTLLTEQTNLLQKELHDINVEFNDMRRAMERAHEVGGEKTVSRKLSRLGQERSKILRQLDTARSRDAVIRISVSNRSLPLPRVGNFPSGMSRSFKAGIIGLEFTILHEYLTHQGDLNQAKLYVTKSEGIRYDEEFLRRKGEECEGLRTIIIIHRGFTPFTIYNIGNNNIINPTDDRFKKLLEQSIMCYNQYKKMVKDLNNEKRKVLKVERDLNNLSDMKKKALIEEALNELKNEDYQRDVVWPSRGEDPTIFRHFRAPDPTQFIQ